MPYPDSPFDASFDTRILTSLKEVAGENNSEKIALEQTLKWLCCPPKVTSYRINPLKTQRNVVAKLIQQHLDALFPGNVFKVQYSHTLHDVIIIKHYEVDIAATNKYINEIVVDVDCAAAVLRGAHIYAPGVLGMVSGTQVGDKVSIYADLAKKCRKGLLKIYNNGRKVFIGNGIVKMARDQLFGDNLSPAGVAIEITEAVSGCPPLGDSFLPPGWALLQNIPSVLCVIALNPQKSDVVLDMCAAPGNKTTHIAALMHNEGVLIAIDKTPKKVEQLKKNCEAFGAHAVSIFQADSCKIVSEHLNSTMTPPFSPATFDKILLDAPCSVLGKRPQLSNKITETVVKSYVPLQRKLFSAAVALLKPKGTLVYSTCTITLAENEGIVAWALKTFDCLELVKPEASYGGPGWGGSLLTEEDRMKVQRFGPDQEVDSVGFFIAYFVKR